MRKGNGGYGLKKSFVALVGGLCAFVAAGFPLNPSFTPEAVKEYKAKSDAGDAEAMCAVARCYQFGLGVARDLEKRIEWMQKAASNGCLRAKGICCANGWGVPENGTHAVAWYHMAIAAGDACAMNCLGLCYEDGIGVETNAEEALLWYRKGAEAGDTFAMWSMARCYGDGVGVAKNEQDAVKWYRKSAELGNPAAMFLLGGNYLQGRGVKSDLVEFEKWWRKSAESGFVMAMNRLAQEYELGDCITGNPTESARWCRLAAELGDVQSMGRLGFFCYKGIGVEKDVPTAIKWFIKAAKGEDVQSWKNLQWLVAHGVEVPKTEMDALKNSRVTVFGAPMGFWDPLHDLDLGWRYDATVCCYRMAQRVWPRWPCEYDSDKGAWYRYAAVYSLLWLAFFWGFHKGEDAVGFVVLMVVIFLLIWSTRWLIMRNEKLRRVDALIHLRFANLSKNRKFVAALVILTVILVPCALEQIGEATDLFHFPVSAWVKGLFK